MQLQNEGRTRDPALFNLAIDSKLRASDLLQIRVSDVCSDTQVNARAMFLQQKTRRPVKFEITPRTKTAIENWIEAARLGATAYRFPGRIHTSPHRSLRQYARIVASRVVGFGLDPSLYGMHSLRRTRATLIYHNTRTIRAVQLLLGHSKLDITVRYLGIEINDALEMSEQIDV